ncbi:MAG: DNA polymerase/3'-5' exonuclease PolX [Candidatus Omnitrophica bacterium]|nr:DNA polymerase/3'-5' exonuclease PolX [Candidatus Omnitrophota bacterium]
MKNFQIAQIFSKYADILEIKEDNPFKIRAYRKAAQSLESLTEDIDKLARDNRLQEIPGIGKDLAEKIKEFLNKGKISSFEELCKSIPEGVFRMLEIPGVGPKTAKMLYEKIGVKSIEELEKLAREHKLSGLPGLKDKTEENILKGIKLLKKGRERMLLGTALPLAELIISELKNLKEVKRITYAGSLRRMKETVRDIDILVTSTHSEKVMEYFVKLKQVKEVLAKGTTKSSILTYEGIQVDLRVVEPESFSSCLLYFTGSKQHNIHLRTLAQKMGLKVSEYGVFEEKTNKNLAKNKEEEEIYKILGLSYIPPELREDLGEIEAAQSRKLPQLLELEDIKGDLHLHSDWSDGMHSLEELAKEGIRRGYEYIAITDHSQSLGIARGLDEERLLRQIEEIKKINQKLRNFRLLCGTEVDIRKDGSLDLDKKVLEKLDVVVAALHTGFKQSKEELTKRVIKAFETGLVNILAHPSGRLLGEREAYELDYQTIFKVAKEKGVCLEINSYPQRLDLTDVNARAAKNNGIILAIGTDSHSLSQWDYMRLGVAVARRAWLEKKDVLNSLPLKELFKKLKSLR